MTLFAFRFIVFVASDTVSVTLFTAPVMFSATLSIDLVTPDTVSPTSPTDSASFSTSGLTATMISCASLDITDTFLVISVTLSVSSGTWLKLWSIASWLSSMTSLIFPSNETTFLSANARYTNTPSPAN